MERRAPNRPPYIQVKRHEARTIAQQVVTQPGPLDTPCRVFTGRVNVHGEPMARAMGLPMPAAVVVLALAGAPVTKRTAVSRTCGNRRCLAVPHLEAMLDRRTAAGTPWRPGANGKRGRAKLSEDQVVEMRRRHVEDAATVNELAAEFGTCRTSVLAVLRGQSWKSVTEGVDVYSSSLEAARERASRARELHARGWTQHAIADELGVCQSSVSQYVTGRLCGEGSR